LQLVAYQRLEEIGRQTSKKKGGEKKEKIPETWAFVVFNYVVDCPVCPSFLARHSGHLGANN